VSDDGTVITSNVGVGIVKAGWHCCGFPQGSGVPNHCPDCTMCNGSQCLPSQICTTCQTVSGGFCNGGGFCLAVPDLIPALLAQNKLTLQLGGKTPLQRSDLTRGNPGCVNVAKDPCFAGFDQAIGPLTLQPPCSGIDLTDAHLEEELAHVAPPTGVLDCPLMPADIPGDGCSVSAGNQLVAFDDSTKPCKDRQLLWTVTAASPAARRSS
jgi:hypothetical protein